MQAAEQARWLTERARALGFDLCGVAPAETFPELANLPEWLARGYADEMKYLEDARRSDPTRAMPGARSVIVCALNYNTALPYSTEASAEIERQKDAGPRGWISRYAWGDDYHQVLGNKLEALITAMRAEFSATPLEARACVDTGPVVERVAAKYAGLGWLAKNTCLINESLGSWLFLGVILTTLELAPTLSPNDQPPADLCGHCRLCLDACPTEALVAPYLLDARRCISYLTIELRGEIPEDLRPAMGKMVFGCDICQDVCPWNRKAPATSLAEFLPRKADGAGAPETLFAPPLEWLASLGEEDFRRIFRGSAIKRTKWRGLVRNACVAIGNSNLPRESPNYSRIVGVLEKLQTSDDAIMAQHARWALARVATADSR